MTDTVATLAVHVLTGPLGSGKSTLLNHALRGGLGEATAVVVNEFGAVGLDQSFIQDQSDEILVLKNGCVCCTVRVDLVDALMRLAQERDSRGWPLARIIVETSGLSDPVPILQTLRSDLRMASRFHAGAVLCTLDLHGGTAVLHERPEYEAQIAMAEVLVPTKADLADEAASADTIAAALAINPQAVVLAPDALAGWLAQYESSPDRTFDALQRLHARPARPDATVAHSRVRQVVLRYPGPLRWTRFAIWLTRLIHLHGDRILRTKGILFDRERGTWIGVHGVRRFFHPPVHLDLSQRPPSGSCLVFITEDLDPDRIAQSYRRLWESDASLDDDPDERQSIKERGYVDE